MSADGKTLSFHATDNLGIAEIYGMLEFVKIETRMQQIAWRQRQAEAEKMASKVPPKIPRPKKVTAKTFGDALKRASAKRPPRATDRETAEQFAPMLKKTRPKKKVAKRT